MDCEDFHPPNSGSKWQQTLDVDTTLQPSSRNVREAQPLQGAVTLPQNTAPSSEIIERRGSKKREIQLISKHSQAARKMI